MSISKAPGKKRCAGAEARRSPSELKASRHSPAGNGVAAGAAGKGFRRPFPPAGLRSSHHREPHDDGARTSGRPHGHQRAAILAADGGRPIPGRARRRRHRGCQSSARVQRLRRDRSQASWRKPGCSTKRANPKDRRAVLLSLTRAGRGLIARHSAEIRAVNDIFFGTLTPSMFVAASDGNGGVGPRLGAGDGIASSPGSLRSELRVLARSCGVAMTEVAVFLSHARPSCSEKMLVKSHGGDRLRSLDRIFACA